MNRYFLFLSFLVAVILFPSQLFAQSSLTAPVVLGVFDDIAICRDFDARYIRQNVNAYVFLQMSETFGTSTDPALSVKNTDIAPPFLYDLGNGLGSYTGHNWTTEQIATYDQDCRSALLPVKNDRSVIETVHTIELATTTQVLLSAVNEDTLVRVTISANALPRPILGGDYTLTVTTLDHNQTISESAEFLRELEMYTKLGTSTSAAPVATNGYSQSAAVIDAEMQTQLIKKTPLILLPTSKIATSSIDVSGATNLLGTHISLQITNSEGDVVPTFAEAIEVAVFNPELRIYDGDTYGFHKGAISETWMQRKWEQQGEELVVPIFGSGLISLWAIDLLTPIQKAEASEFAGTSRNYTIHIQSCMPILSFTLLLGVFVVLYRSKLVTEELTRTEVGHPIVSTRSSTYIVQHFVLLFLVATEILLLGYVGLCIFVL